MKRTEAMPQIEWICHSEQPLAVIIRAAHAPRQSEFITPDTYKQQVGFIVYKAREAIQPHVHRETQRTLRGTSEVLLVRQGRCHVDFYTDDKLHCATRELRQGDVLVLVSGGHGFRMIEDTIFLEVKQGPYMGPQEKERFAPPVAGPGEAQA